ncbi:MAG: isoaspartyl peptidase/L-asparaginase family protein [Aggregatilineales bacterium]
MKPAILVHGGAGPWVDETDEARKVSLKEAAMRGWQLLQEGKSALDAVEAATHILEDFPLFDAGIGSFLTANGEVEMDALLIDGATLNFGAIAGVKHVRYPISLARRVLTMPQNFFVGAGADALAVKLGFEPVPNQFFVTDEERANFLESYAKKQPAGVGTGTVGAVAIDSNGNIASATSTGGSPNKIPGRVGDSPIFGAGGYADNRYGAAGATGVGENIMRVLLSKHAVDRIAAGDTASQAAQNSIAYIEDFISGSEAGLIVVDKDGNIGAAHTTSKLAIGWIDADGHPQASMKHGI